MFNKVLVANRGAVAARVLRALNEMKMCTRSRCIQRPIATLLTLKWRVRPLPSEPLAARESYLNQDTLIDVLKKSGATACIPGYGFLSENASFAQKVIDSRRAFHRAVAEMDRRDGPQDAARDIAAEYGMPMSQGSGVLPDDNDAIIAAARKIGFPVLVKPAGGGGGIGMLPAKDESELLDGGGALALARGPRFR
jgi:acetyl-CoA carboxylase, biotin carboxylase subunit